MKETITFEIPLSAQSEEKSGLTVDALFTALDHGSAYHEHEGNYAEMYENLREYLYEQAKAQLNE